MVDGLSRRAALGVLATGAAVAAGCGAQRSTTSTTTVTEPATVAMPTQSARPQIADAAGALAELKAGNARFVDARMEHPAQDPQHRLALSKGQDPFAVVLSCSDSRLPPEVIFDQGLGDLFVVRVAGNIVDPALLGSIEYAVGHLHTPLVLVLGHQNCGAVAATLEALQTHTEPHGDIAALVSAIKPAVGVAGSRPGDLLDNTIRANVEQSRDQIIASPELKLPLDAGDLNVVTAYYSLNSGEVEFT
jgi:carbonic anhydrase